MAKEKQSTVSDQQSTVSSQQSTEENIIGPPKLEEILMGLEAFASAKELPWTIKVRLNHYAEQNKVTEQTFDEWEKIVVQL